LTWNRSVDASSVNGTRLVRWNLTRPLFASTVKASASVVDPLTSTPSLLLGGEGNDVLAGGGGDDRIVGDRGADTMNGGAGDDTLVWNNGDGTDVINGDTGRDDVEVNGAPAGGDVFRVPAQWDADPV
jgi:Ca2+-binding RTX toxin-like protein